MCYQYFNTVATYESYDLYYSYLNMLKFYVAWLSSLQKCFKWDHQINHMLLCDIVNAILFYNPFEGCENLEIWYLKLHWFL